MMKSKNVLTVCLTLFAGLAANFARAGGPPAPALKKMRGEVVFGFEQRIFEDEVTDKEYWVKATPTDQPFAGKADGKGVRYEVEAEILLGAKDGYGHLGQWQQAINIKSWKLLGAAPKSPTDPKKEAIENPVDQTVPNNK